MELVLIPRKVYDVDFAPPKNVKPTTEYLHSRKHNSIMQKIAHR
jgi:hypothetical protein